MQVGHHHQYQIQSIRFYLEFIRKSSIFNYRSYFISDDINQIYLKMVIKGNKRIKFQNIHIIEPLSLERLIQVKFDLAIKKLLEFEN